VPGYFETFSINEKVVDVTLVKIHEIEYLYDPVEAEIYSGFENKVPIQLCVSSSRVYP
jgi:hypothetical protein